tara:strand:+ start:15634 stop:17184 length:1551 start_codon:yes stop_codon:yes gene_type:complete
VQLGFVIDHSRCIGCHACTVACKSENDVPLGSFRTWVKYTEAGTFPEVNRSFAVLRCNQCSEPPCVEICPTTALTKSSATGIVDIDPDRCIGCKSCMHGCPYDALYINPGSGTAEKCHFCAHRTEIGLAPACAVVCPTEAIIPGDFDDPASLVSRMKADGAATARKTEAGTRPNVFYKEVDPTGVDPGATNLSSGYLWAQNPTGPRVDAQTFEALERKARTGAQEAARTTYDVPRSQLWGSKITGYLFFKSLAGGLLPVAFLAQLFGGNLAESVDSLAMWPTLLSIVFLAATLGLLVADLKRPERFWMLMVKGNWSSWLVRGSWIITAYGALMALFVVRSWFGIGDTQGVAMTFGALALVLGGATAAYTAWLFGQAKGRVLWMKRGYATHLLFQALLAGSAAFVLLSMFVDVTPAVALASRCLLAAGLLGQFICGVIEHEMAPTGREVEFARASRLVSHGPYQRAHLTAVLVGLVVPFLILLMLPALLPVAAVLALVGLFIEEEIFVRAGQALPIS